MAFGVFMHRADTIYDDLPTERYHFPNVYMSRAEKFVPGWVVYLEPSKVVDSRGYFAVARTERIVPDTNASNMSYALIAPGTYLEFPSPVPFSAGTLGLVERGLLNDGGVLSGRAQAAVRPMVAEDFQRIIEAGLAEDISVMPRNDAGVGTMADDCEPFNRVHEDALPFLHAPSRMYMTALETRSVRDRAFRKLVLAAYGERCAVTGLRLINGGGRAEAEAAHIRPVAHGGPDALVNGLALSGTAHWMFDRGLISVSDDHVIMVSRHVNDLESIAAMLPSHRRLNVPARAAAQPHPAFLAWHRENVFKH